MYFLFKYMPLYEYMPNSASLILKVKLHEVCCVDFLFPVLGHDQ